MTNEEKIEILREAQEAMSEALEKLRPLAAADPNKKAYVYEHLDSLINSPSNSFDQSLLTWIEELYEADGEED